MHGPKRMPPPVADIVARAKTDASGPSTLASPQGQFQGNLRVKAGGTLPQTGSAGLPGQTSAKLPSENYQATHKRGASSFFSDAWQKLAGKSSASKVPAQAEGQAPRMPSRAHIEGVIKESLGKDVGRPSEKRAIYDLEALAADVETFLNRLDATPSDQDIRDRIDHHRDHARLSDFALSRRRTAPGGEAKASEQTTTVRLPSPGAGRSDPPSFRDFVKAAGDQDVPASRKKLGLDFGEESKAGPAEHIQTEAEVRGKKTDLSIEKEGLRVGVLKHRPLFAFTSGPRAAPANAEYREGTTHFENAMASVPGTTSKPSGGDEPDAVSSKDASTPTDSKGSVNGPEDEALFWNVDELLSGGPSSNAKPQQSPTKLPAQLPRPNLKSKATTPLKVKTDGSRDFVAAAVVGRTRANGVYLSDQQRAAVDAAVRSRVAAGLHEHTKALFITETLDLCQKAVGRGKPLDQQTIDAALGEVRSTLPEKDRWMLS